jgi:hypothetical protein
MARYTIPTHSSSVGPSCRSALIFGLRGSAALPRGCKMYRYPNFAAIEHRLSDKYCAPK